MDASRRPRARRASQRAMRNRDRLRQVTSLRHAINAARSSDGGEASGGAGRADSRRRASETGTSPAVLRSSTAHSDSSRHALKHAAAKLRRSRRSEAAARRADRAEAGAVDAADAAHRAKEAAARDRRDGDVSSGGAGGDAGGAADGGGGWSGGGGARAALCGRSADAKGDGGSDPRAMSSMARSPER